MNKTTEALKLAAEALYTTGNALMVISAGRKLRQLYGEIRDDAAERCNKALAAIREALAEPVKQEPALNKYNHKRIGWELERTAMGDSYYGNALYSAMDLHFLNQREKDCLHRYMHGSETPNDRFVLQDIANKVYFEPEAEQEPVACVNGCDTSKGKCADCPDPAPVDAKAIRAEALKEAIKIVDNVLGRQNAVSAAIRGLK